MIKKRKIENKKIKCKKKFCHQSKRKGNKTDKKEQLDNKNKKIKKILKNQQFIVLIEFLGLKNEKIKN